MKKVILLLVMVMSTIFSFAQDETRIKNLKEQKEILSLTTKLNKLQLDYEKEKVNNVELSKKAADINAEANIATTEFNTTNASNTVKDAKTTIKRLKEAKSINKKLAKSQKTLKKMERKIAKLQSKIDDCNKRIKFVNNNNNN